MSMMHTMYLLLVKSLRTNANKLKMLVMVWYC